MLKKVISIVLVLLLLCAFVPLAFATEGGGVAARLANVQTMSGYTVGTGEYNCYLFAGRVFRMLFESETAPNINYHGDYDSNNHNTKLIARLYTSEACSIVSCGGKDPTSDEAKALTLGRVSIENTRTLLSMAMVGDILQGHRGDGVHTMVVQKVNYNNGVPVSVTVYHGNWNSQVTISTFTVEFLVETYDHALSVFRATNYYLIDSGTSIYFNPEGGDAAYVSKFVGGGEQIGTLPTVTRAGYSFNGWYTAATGGTKREAAFVPIESTMNLYAQWSPESYTVTFDAAGGACTTPSKTVTYGGNYGSLPDAQREGYTFAGWATKATETDTITRDTAVTLNHNHTLYAIWTPNVYTVDLVPGEGALDVDELDVAFGQPYGALPVPSYAGYLFTGWSPDEALTTVLTDADPVAIAKDHTLYATYDPLFTGAIAGLTATSDQSDRINLNWDETAGASGYEIYRAKTAAEELTLLATVEGQAANSYTDEGLTEGESFFYAVRAFQHSGRVTQYSAYTEPVHAAASIMTPATPAKLRGSTTAATYVSLAWPSVAGATGYEIQRSTSPDGPFLTLYVTPNNSTTNTACEPGTTYYYRVTAIRAVGDSIGRSAPTETVEVTTRAH